MGNFDRQGVGGAIGSRIDEQDGVAALLVLRMLADTAERADGSSRVAGATLSCESLDDLVFADRERLMLISVKNSPLGPAAVISESARLQDRAQQVRKGLQVTRTLYLIGAADPATVQLASSLTDLQAVLEGPVDRDATISDWIANNASTVTRRKLATKKRPEQPAVVKAVQHPESFRIEFFQNRMDSEPYRAEAARLLRKIVPLTDFSDKRVDQVIRQIHSDLGEARRNRRTLPIEHFVGLLAAITVPPIIQASLSPYRRTPFGYSVDAAFERHFEHDAKLVRRAHREARRRFNKGLRQEVLKAQVLGPIRCLECGHAMNGNLWGFGPGGTLCPRCHFSPYLSLVYACECGKPVLLVKQPTLVQADLMIDISKAVEKTCEHCNREIERDRLTTRMFTLGMPWPPEDFTGAMLIQERERAGLSKDAIALGKERLQSLPETGDGGHHLGGV